MKAMFWTTDKGFRIFENTSSWVWSYKRHRIEREKTARKRGPAWSLQVLLQGGTIKAK
jgi:hypothetical protein